jgi:hypothetical protein
MGQQHESRDRGGKAARVVYREYRVLSVEEPLERQVIEREISHQMLEPTVLLIEQLEPTDLMHSESAIDLLPTIIVCSALSPGTPR